MADDLSQADIEALRSIFREELDGRSRLDVQVHDNHHRWVEKEILRLQKRAERCEKIKQHVIGWGLVVAIGAMGKFLYDAVVGELAKAFKA